MTGRKTVRVKQTEKNLPIELWASRLQMIAHVCTALALIALGYQLWADAQTRRTERALSYVERFNSDPTATHRDNLERAWLPEHDNLSEQNESGGLSQKEQNRLTAFVLAEFDAKKGQIPSQISIIQLTNFFDQLLLCREEELCDHDTIDSYFASQIRAFWRVYQSKIYAARKAGTTGLGTELQTYVEEPKNG